MYTKILSPDKTEYTAESISFQKNDAIVGQLTSVYSELINLVNDRGLKQGKTFKDRNVKVLFARMDTMLTKRFGIKFRTVESGSQYIGIATTPPKLFNVLAGDVDKNFKRTMDLLNGVAPETKGKSVDPDNIDTATSGWKDAIMLNLQSINNVDKKMQVADVTVDLTVAKIYGYPEDSASVLYINPIVLLRKCKLTPSELAAVTLHEVGHAFTHIEYAHRTVKTMSMLMEGLLDGIKNNKAPLDAIKLGYYKAFEDDDIKETTTVVSASVGIASKYISRHVSYGDSDYGNKESERLADYFAAQFGVGSALVPALDKMNAVIDTTKAPITMLKSLALGGILLFALSLVLLAFIPVLGIFSILLVVGGVSTLGTLFMMGFVIYVILNGLGALISRGVDNTNPYDNLNRRIKRIKNALIRQLKTADLTKDEIKSILSAIETIETAGSKVETYDENVIYRTIGKLFSHAGKQDELRAFDNLVDDLLHNDLFAASKKLEIAHSEV